MIIRLLPSEPFEKLFKSLGLLGRDLVLPSIRPEAEGWSGASALVRDNLGTFANIRGGRMRSSSLVVKSRLMRRGSHDMHRPLKVYVHFLYHGTRLYTNCEAGTARH